MSYEPALTAALGALVEGRIWPDEAPEPPRRPYMTWQQVGGVAPNFLEATPIGKRHARLQVNVWADNRLSANAVIRQVEDAMMATFKAESLGAFVARNDPLTNLKGSQQDFGIWY